MNKNNRFTGPLKAVIFDWAGTIADYGCFAPTGAFIEIFRRKGIDITTKEARGPMGMHKREHINEITKYPRIREQWLKTHRKNCSEQDIDDMYAEFIPLQISVLEKHSDIVPELRQAVKVIRSSDLKIGSTTGYNREMMQVVTAAAARQGFRPDCMICASDVPAGRPAPWMAFKNAEALGIYPMEAIVKIGDTVADIREGINAGMWSVGVIKSSNEMGLTLDEVSDLDPLELEEKMAEVKNTFLVAGADFVIDTLADISELLNNINLKLAAGQGPGE